MDVTCKESHLLGTIISDLFIRIHFHDSYTEVQLSTADLLNNVDRQ